MIRISTAIAVLLFAGLVAGQDFDSPQTELVPVNQVEHGFSRPRGDIWNLTKKAKHHDAVVRVSVRGGAGTGCVVATDTGMVVVTNRHVIEVPMNDGSGRAIPSPNINKIATVDRDGATPGQMEIIWASEQDDIAVLWHSQARWEPAVPVCDRDAKDGDVIELCGYGGPTKQLRTFLGRKLNRHDAAIQIDAPSVSGDSGGPMLLGGTICGVNFGSVNSYGDMNRGAIDEGRHPDGSPNVWGLSYPASSNVNTSRLVEILNECGTKRGFRFIRRPPCESGTCPPQSPQIEIESPINAPAPPQTQPPVSSPSRPGCRCNPCQCEAGPCNTSQPGPAGPAGKDGVDGKDAEVTPQQLGAIAAAITEQLKADPALRGPKGDTGPAGADCQVDYQKLTDMVIAQLPPIYPQWIDKDNNVIDSIPGGVRLGQTMPLRIDVIQKIVSEAQSAGTRPQ